MREWLHDLRSGTRSLKTQLALYFIPISILPVIGISIYATRVFQEGVEENIQLRAASDREAIIAEIEDRESQVLSQVRSYSRISRLHSAVQAKEMDRIVDVLEGLRPVGRLRTYTAEGNFLVQIPAATDEALRVQYLSKEGLRKVRAQGETLERYFLEGGQGISILARALLKDKDRLYGILEQEFILGNRELAEIKNRRQLDVILLNRDLTQLTGSLALSYEEFQSVVKANLVPTVGPRKPVFFHLGDARYASFLSDLPGTNGRPKNWGHLLLLFSMTGSDATSAQLKLNILYITAFLTLGFALLIFFFSNRIVKPIEVLIAAMKRVKTGTVEELPPIDSTYEIEYLVRSFNDMIRNVASAKRALELKLGELRNANDEIKNTQSTLVQSAKMISLGQIVAGVAHELNNPIAFIYSNMHHLSEYVTRLKDLVEEYHRVREQLPPKVRAEVEALEKKLDIEFVIKDMSELTRSCLDGANRTKDIVLGLRTFSRMEEAGVQPTDVHAGLESTLKLLTAEIKGRITVHREFGELPLIEASASQLNQVFMNLLSNAAHAIQGKGDIWIRTLLLSERVEIVIEDSGSGMSPETLEKIFDPFFTTKKVGQGTGLGLSIAYGLIQKHHGEIRVQSESGRGTRFTLNLPIKQPRVRIAS